MPPFFIIGFERSGTTLLRLMMDNHPDISVPLDVSDLWKRYYLKLGDYNNLKDAEAVRKIVEDIINEERIKLWEKDISVDEIIQHINKYDLPSVIKAFYESYAIKNGKRSWGSKDPINMLNIHLINNWFPNSKFIHIIRDARDCALSASELKYNSILSSAELWREYVEWVRKIGCILGSKRFYELKYEDLITCPEEEVRKLCEFLETSFSPNMLAYYKHVESSIPQSKRFWWRIIDKPPDASNKYRWKRSLPKSVRICIEKRAGSLLKELGYEVLEEPAGGAYLTELYYIFKNVISYNKRFHFLQQLTDMVKMPY